MESTHLYQKKITGVNVSTHVLDPRYKIAAITGKQTSTLQGYTKTHMDVRHTPLGFTLPLKYQNLAKISE
jgi:hypothetical protein